VNDTDVACGVVTLALCLRMFETAMHKGLVERIPTQDTSKSYERYRGEEAKLV
jgi:hypothetical protein